MSSCTSCGHQLGVGRFCTNCGAAVDPSTPDGTPVSTPVTPPPAAEDWRTDTAERTQAGPATAPGDPRTPPAAVAPPPPPRYPLYADEVQSYSSYGPLEPARAEPASAYEALAPEPVIPEDDLGYDEEYEYDEERRSPVLWILVAALVLVLVAAGWWFLVRDDGTDPTAQDAGTGQSAEGSPTAADEGVDVARRASAKAPSTAPPNEDVNGDQVSYDASNMLDGVPETAWRTPGDATGMSLTFTLREPTELHRIGLINGYAKTSTDAQNRSFDWYLGNRRVNAVVWQFDDGSKVRQQLSETRELQMIDVDDVITGTVVLKIVRVSPPGEGTASRNFTAISEVSLVGEPTT
jgi:hypothetical protein